MSMEFLYFPEDKLEYIPSLIMLFMFVLGAIVTMYIFYKKSKKEDATQPHKEYPKHIETETETEPESEPESEPKLEPKTESELKDKK